MSSTNSLSRRKKGDGSWGERTINGIKYIYYRKKYDNKQNMKYFYGKTQKEVKQKIAKYESKNTLQNDKEKSKIILSEFALTWLENYKKPQIKKKKYYDTLKAVITYYIEPFDIANYQLHQIDDDVINKHYSTLANKYSLSVIKKTHSLLTQVFSYAKAKYVLGENPYTTGIIIVPNEENVASKKKEIEFLDDEDIEKFFSEANRINTESLSINGKIGTPVYKGTNKYILILILYSGMRINEALGLKWEDYDEKKSVIIIQRTLSRVSTGEKKEVNGKIINTHELIENSPKTKSGIRGVKLPSRAVWAINKLKESAKDITPSNKICVTATGTTPSEGSLTRTLHCIAKRAELKVDHHTFGLHDLRHTYGSYLLRHGVDINIISNLLGHKDVSTTRNIYIHILEKQKAESVEIFDMQKIESD